MSGPSLGESPPQLGKSIASGGERTALTGILLLLGAGLLFSVMDATAKYLSQRYSVVEIAWARYVFHAVTLPLIVGRFGSIGGLAALRSQRLGLQLWRSLFLLGSTFCSYLAISFIPLADATAIGFIGPLIVTALSVPFLKERVGPRRWAAVTIGFLGALVIIRPGPGMGHPAALFSVASAACFACYAISTRIVSRTDQWSTTLIWSASVGTVVLSAAVPFTWRTPDLAGWLAFGFLGLIGSLSHLLLILAYARAPASTLAPLSYLQLVWSTSFGLLMFGNFPDHWTLGGAAVIVASGLYVLYRERRRRGEIPRG
jgi:drug/metabolite transporter (DMT)-like permease